jgi:glucosamine--fructose-6-phosphate aminotransferase (isomerizing)
MISEIREIPERASLCYRENKQVRLPSEVPYLGMGSSYFAPLAMKYLGCNIYPEIASEYYHYTHRNRKFNEAVLLSQSGRSSETLWCTERFSEYTAIVNDTGSPLARSAKEVIAMHAGEEKHSASKTYVNTLITLYQGLGMDAGTAVTAIGENMGKYEEWGEQQAEFIHDLYTSRDAGGAGRGARGIYILGNGPDAATACEAALILTESTRIPFTPMALPQYDHGPKEAAQGCIVLNIRSDGPAAERGDKLMNTLSRAGAYVASWDDRDVPEHLSPICSIIPFNCLAYFLGKRLGIRETFALGNKITMVDKE